jgi:hypothetical protein
MPGRRDHHATGGHLMRTATATKWVYDFAEGSRDMRELLGGKGSGIAEMTRVLSPDLVPAGFTITTEACGDRQLGRPPPEAPVAPAALCAKGGNGAAVAGAEPGVAVGDVSVAAD